MIQGRAGSGLHAWQPQRDACLRPVPPVGWWLVGIPCVWMTLLSAEAGEQLMGSVAEEAAGKQLLRGPGGACPGGAASQPSPAPRKMPQNSAAGWSQCPPLPHAWHNPGVQHKPKINERCLSTVLSWVVFSCTQKMPSGFSEVCTVRYSELNARSEGRNSPETSSGCKEPSSQPPSGSCQRCHGQERAKVWGCESS